MEATGLPIAKLGLKPMRHLTNSHHPLPQHPLVSLQGEELPDELEGGIKAREVVGLPRPAAWQHQTLLCKLESPLPRETRKHSFLKNDNYCITMRMRDVLS